MNNYKEVKALTITYLTNISYASLNGGDSDTDNINVIKKIAASGGNEFPYVSSQALRRALRDQLQTLGYKLSPVSIYDTGSDSEPDSQEGTDSAKKHPPITKCDPVAYIDDDLFGYMNAKTETLKRTSPVRVSPLVALTKFMGDIDFGTNYMGKDSGGDPNIFETEIHRGLYRGTILIELDRVGTDDGFIITTKAGKKAPVSITDKSLSNTVKFERCCAFLDAFQNLWSSGRQSRFLADISPKFMAAALTFTKNPIFLESMPKGVDIEELKQVVKDYQRFIKSHVFASQSSFHPLGDEVMSLDKGFAEIRNWLQNYYQV